MLRCPLCGSRELFQVTGGYLSSEYRCKDCGYQGTFVIESEEEMPHPGVPDTNSSRIDIPLWIRIGALILLLIIIAIGFPRW